MTNLILFVNSFLSYLLIFVFIIALVIIACVIGVKWGKARTPRRLLPLRRCRRRKKQIMRKY